MANVMGFDNATVTGNVIKIAPGNYGGAFMTPSTFPQPMIIDAQGATFSASIYLPDKLENFEFRNFTFQGVQNECFRWAVNKVGVGLRNLKFINNKATDCGSFCLIGNYDDYYRGTDISENLEFGGNIITKNRTNGVFFFGKSYNLKFHDNQVLTAGSSAIDDRSHEGIVFMRWSDGELWNNYITDGGGNGFRVWAAGNKKRGLVNIHDNYVVNMRKHSAVETNGDNLGGITGDVIVKYNTFGNLAKGNYESAGIAVYLENLPSKDTFVESNVVFNTSKGAVFYGDGAKPSTEVNNFYFPTAADAKIDIKTGKLLLSSPAYGKAGAWITPLDTTTSTSSSTTTTTTAAIPVSITRFNDGKVLAVYGDGSYKLQ